MFFFLKKTLYEGTSLKELAHVRDTLSAAGIRYDIRAMSQGRTALPSRNTGCTLYEVRVKASDLDKARYLLGSS